MWRRALTLALVASLCSGACAFARGTADDDQNAAFRIGLASSKQSSLNPLTCASRDVSSLLALCFEGLVTWGDDMRPEKNLADSWMVREEGKNWVFNLRKGVTFHNGKELTADDVSASAGAILAAGDASPYASMFQYIESVSALDARTVVVNAKVPNFNVLLAMDFPVLERGTVNTILPAGTGPFALQDNVDGHIRLVLNENWWKKPPLLDSLVAECMGDAEGALSRLDTADVDAVATRSFSASRYRGIPSYQVSDYQTRQFECLVPNLRRPPFSSLEVRQALMYAIDTSALAATVYLNMVVTANAPIPPGSFLDEPRVQQYTYNLETARSLLASAGWADTDGDGILDREAADGSLQRFAIKLLTYDEPDSPSRTDAAQLLSEQLAKVNIQLDVEVASFEAMPARLQSGDFDIALCAFYLDRLPELSFIYGKDGACNFSGYSSADMDEFLGQVNLAYGEDEYRMAISRVQTLALQDLPIIGLFMRTGALITRKPLSGVRDIREGGVFKGVENWGID